MDYRWLEKIKTLPAVKPGGFYILCHLYVTVFKLACERDVPAFHDSDDDNRCDPGNGDNSCADNDGDNSRDSGNDGNDEPADDGECYSKSPVWRMPRQIKIKRRLKWIKFS